MEFCSGPMTGAQAHAQAMALNAMRQHNQETHKGHLEHAKTRAKKPTDKTMPDGIEEFVIGDGVQEYKKLRDVERRLDAIMMRKRMELAEPRPQISKRTQTLRIWISNTAENQPWQGKSLEDNAFDFNSGQDSTYKVSINGRILSTDADDDEDKAGEKDKHIHAADAMEQDNKEDEENDTETPAQPRQKLSHFFKSILVEHDRSRNIQGESNTIAEWKKPQIHPNIPNPPVQADFDCLDFERKSDENINCTISLYRDDIPERFIVSKQLADIIDCYEGTREDVINAICDYARAMEIQQDDEKRLINCDDRLKAVCLGILYDYYRLTHIRSSKSRILLYHV